MIPGDLLSAFPLRQFHTLPGLKDSCATLPNSNPNTCMPMQGGSLYHFYDGLWYDPAGRRTHYLLCERRTRYRQPDTVYIFGVIIFSVLEREQCKGAMRKVCRVQNGNVSCWLCVITMKQHYNSSHCDP